MNEPLIGIAKKAGEFFLRRELTEISSKEGHANYVTNIDCMVQEYLEKTLTQLVPGSLFIGEEQENQHLTEAPTWIVDPLDGTTNLIRDYRMSAVSIALCAGREPVTGVIWQPYMKELFYAEKGKGASLNGKKITVADTPFSRALVAFGTAPYYEELEEKSFRIAAEFMHSCADIRRSGSAAVDLAYLACGRHDVFFELRLKPWDYAAGALLVQEAGGRFWMPMLSGRPDYDQSTAIAAAAPACAEQVRRVLEKHIGKIS